MFGVPHVAVQEARLLVPEGCCKSFSSTDRGEVGSGEAFIVAIDFRLWRQLMSVNRCLALEALDMPHILFLTSHLSHGLLAYQHSISDIPRHRLVVVEEAFRRHHFFPAHPLSRMLPSRINLHRPDLA